MVDSLVCMSEVVVRITMYDDMQWSVKLSDREAA